MTESMVLNAPALKESFDEKLSSNINDLYGMIEGISYDGVVDEKEIGQLRQWIRENLK